MCMCTMRESCEECSDPSFFTDDIEVEPELKDAYTFGQELFYVEKYQVKSGQFCGIESNDLIVLRLKDGDLEHLDSDNVTENKAKAEASAKEGRAGYIKRLHLKVQSQQKDIESCQRMIERYQKEIAELEGQNECKTS